MDCLDLLTADHNRVRGLFKRFKDAESSDDMETMKLVTAGLSLTGSVLGIAQTEVKPPATAAAAPVAMVSLYS